MPSFVAHYSIDPLGACIVCLCKRGTDHHEDLFDVPVGEED